MRLALTSFFLSLIIFTNAQDIIIYKDGSEKETKVLKINANEIVFKKYSNLNGPEYTEAKSNIFMIKYEGGEKDVFKSNIAPITEKEIEENYTLENGTLITLYFREALTSKEMSNGQLVKLAVKDEVVSKDGKIIIAANTIVNGRITNVKNAAWAGQKGKIGLQVNNIKAVDGTSIPVYYNMNAEGKSKQSTAIGIGVLLFWPALFIKGKEATINSGQIIMVETMSTINFNTASFPKKILNQISEGSETTNYNNINSQLNKTEPCGERPKAPPKYNNPQYKKTPEYKVYYKKLKIWRNCTGN